MNIEERAAADLEEAFAVALEETMCPDSSLKIINLLIHGTKDGNYFNNFHRCMAKWFPIGLE